MQVSRLIAFVVTLLVPMPVFAQVFAGPPILWHDRGNIATLDLLGGSGGKDHEPGFAFKFIKEYSSGTSPKFQVEDENGIRWKVKLGEEAKAETAATRLFWAVGYIVDDDYYRDRIHVAGLKGLKRGRQYVSDDTVRGARLERETKGDSTIWSWFDNPFSGTRELNGLRVMMALVNGWDLKADNNGALDGQYGVNDLGASYGRTGNTFMRSKSNLRDYRTAKFIQRVTPTHVDFVMHSRPFFLFVFNVNNYRARTKMERIAKNIPIDDARWIGSQLGRLTSDQIRDSFRAGGFSTQEVNAFAQVVIARIAQLNKL